MAAKPAPRRASTLAGQHPVGPAPTQPPTPPAATTATTTAATAPGAVTTARSVTTAKTTFVADADTLDAAKNAFWASRNAGRHRTFADFINDALRRLTTDLQTDLNDGKPFPTRPTADLPRGRVAG